METPSPSGPGKLAPPLSADVTSHTLHPGGGGMGDMDFDQTIKFKTPGTGMTVFSRYKLQRVLGRGGMGVVWLADDLKLERPVALKFLPSLIGLDPAAVKELKTETRRGLELSHPHIVRIYDFVDDEDAAAISMEFVDGKTLSELRMTTESGVFSVEDISTWLLGVCDALDYAHFQRKLIHRDLKPANIMLAGTDRVAKIADFGIARSLADTMSRLSAAHIGTSGTLPYMSPQQAMGERPQPTDDVYSLGATIYELLSGKPPFYRGDLPTQINSKIPPTMQERRQELEINGREPVPKLWEETIAACLHKEPTMRPSCAGVMAEMLGLKPSTVSVRTGSYASSQARAIPEKTTNHVPMIAAAATLIIGVGAAAWYIVGATTGNNASAAAAVEQTEPKTAVAAASPAAEENQDKSKSGETRAKGESKDGESPNEPAATVAAVGTAPAEESPEPMPEPAATSAPAPAPAPLAGLESPPPPVTPEMTPPATSLPPEPVGTVAAAGEAPATPTPAPAPATAGSSVPAPAGTVVPGPAPALATATAMATTTPPAGTLPATTSDAGLALEPDPSTATPGALAAMTPPPAPAPAQNLPPMPPGFEVPATGLVLTQPDVPQPPSGFWTLEQVFPVLPHASYSPKGKRYLLYRAQSVLKEAGLYTSTLDGAEGKGTHNAIVLFQVRNGLLANGLLDLPTLAALNLSAEPDKPDWAPSYSGGGSSGYRKRSQPKEEPGFFQKTGDTFKRIFK